MKTAIFSESQLLMTPSLTQYTGLLVYLTESEHCLYSITKKTKLLSLSLKVCCGIRNNYVDFFFYTMMSIKGLI